ncbi:leucine-rich repeat extensin-like protein 1 isoform X2 [Carassius auratus]|uniref:Leucine-rich repeat extensin-like protein 1 isoform X2 n=1 Tax=Carassius auratus TaxID=7957 RepID=A0A6P6LVA5_CARAU|nr:leucine-rich repeat extensin-like protein 1 isoform X2 [Carassius auratus]
MHTTVLRKGEKITIEQCISCCDKYHCPFCETWVYKPVDLYSVTKHVQDHLKTAVREEASAQTAPLLQPQPSPSEPRTSVSPTPSTPLYQPKVCKGPPLPSPLSTFTSLPAASAQTAPLLQAQPSPSEPRTSVSPTPSTPLYQPKVCKGPPLPSPLSTFTSLPAASAQTAPLLQPQPSPSEPRTSVSPTPSTPLYQPKVCKGPPLPSPLSTFTSLPAASAQTAPLLQAQPSPSEPRTSVSPTPSTPLYQPKVCVVNWSAFSVGYRQEFRVPYSLTQCLWCHETFKDCPPGYVGNGRRGVLRGFYSYKDFRATAQLIVLLKMEVNFRMCRCRCSFFFLSHVSCL